MARKAALPKTRFGDGYEPAHMESIERLAAKLSFALLWDRSFERKRTQ
jgi:hypothetical protein